MRPEKRILANLENKSLSLAACACDAFLHIHFVVCW